MADLKTFAAFDLNTPYLDVADTERGFHAAHAKQVVSDYAAVPAGALNFSGPNTYDRTLTQYNGAAYTGFNLKVDKLTVNAGVDLGVGNSQLYANASDMVLQGSTNTYFQYNRAGAVFNTVVASSLKLATKATGSYFFSPVLATTLGASSPIASFENNNGNLCPVVVTAERTAAGTDWTTASTRLHKKVDVTFMGFVEFGGANNPSGVTIGAGQAATAQAVPGVVKIGGAGRTTIGSDVVDDGSTMLQTGSLKATTLSLTAQPGIRDGAGNNATVSGGTSGPLDISTFTGVGGMTVNSNGSILCRVTAPMAGRYQFTLQIFTSLAPAVGTFTGELSAVLNNSTGKLLANKIVVASGESFRVTNSTFVQYMQAGDYIHFALIDSGPSGYPVVVRIAQLDVQKIN
jgi:hypothetical protein